MADSTSNDEPDRLISDRASADGAFSDEDLVGLFQNFRGYASVVLAVSGGADSVALMMLVRRWRDLVPDPPTITVATIDHDLRAGSADEAKWVAERAKALGLAHVTKRWTGTKPATGIQAAARTARYRLLLDIFTEHKLPAPAAIVTAHTQDDQAETVVMRLSRGSGVDGLGAMAAQRALKAPGKPVMLLRPLLGIPKSRLVACLTTNKHTWLEDPSNRSRDFERIRLRQALPQLEALGVTPSALALSAARARRARRALGHVASEFLTKQVALNHGAFAELARDALCSQPDEIQIRVLSCVLAAYGGASPEAGLSQIEVLQAHLKVDNAPGPLTLGGCIISNHKGWVRIYREPGRMSAPELELTPGTSLTWDNRFRIAVSPKTDPTTSGVRARALDAATFAGLKMHLSAEFAGIPVAAAQTLPSFWREDQLVAVPTLKIGPAQMAEIGDHQASQDAARVREQMPADPPRQKDLETGHEACRGPAEVVFIGLGEHRFGT